jgi:hypothetical protein
MQRHPEFGLSLMADLHRRAVLAEVSALQGDKQSVEVPFHRFINLKSQI